LTCELKGPTHPSGVDLRLLYVGIAMTGPVGIGLAPDIVDSAMSLDTWAYNTSMDTTSEHTEANREIVRRAFEAWQEGTNAITDTSI
jgi:hypothetical protein